METVSTLVAIPTAFKTGRPLEVSDFILYKNIVPICQIETIRYCDRKIHDISYDELLDILVKNKKIISGIALHEDLPFSSLFSMLFGYAVVTPLFLTETMLTHGKGVVYGEKDNFNIRLEDLKILGVTTPRFGAPGSAYSFASGFESIDHPEDFQKLGQGLIINAIEIIASRAGISPPCTLDGTTILELGSKMHEWISDNFKITADKNQQALQKQKIHFGKKLASLVFTDKKYDSITNFIDRNMGWKSKHIPVAIEFDQNMEVIGLHVYGVKYFSFGGTPSYSYSGITAKMLAKKVFATQNKAASSFSVIVQGATIDTIAKNKIYFPPYDNISYKEVEQLPLF